MKLTIENIGSLKTATIDLKDITVIAGENDSGKSTIGKVFFALIQAFSNYPILLQNERKQYIQSQIERIYFELRRNFDLAHYPDIRETFSISRTFRRSEILDDSILMEMTMMLNRLYEISPEKSPILKHSQARLDNLREYVSVKLSEKEAIANSILKALQSEFSGEIVRKPQSEPARIILADGETTILNLLLTDEKILDFQGEEEIEFNDATFVDGPAVIQFHNAMSGFSPLGESHRQSESMPFHTLDLSQKLRNGGFNLFSIGKGDAFELSNTYKGKLYFDKEKKSFLLDKGSYHISSNNIASGVKALGLLDMLIEGDYIREHTLLILDEPETNLHPKWQIEYAKMLCKLSKAGATILITTHSPYMVEALKGYVGKYKINGGFYVSRRNPAGEIEYNDCTRDITPIITALSEPLSDLIDEISDDF
ncbi:AAA ATPase-like protein [Janthinobacterium sp. 35]|uniref:AAA family ATPase n=1 Tax=Janthinobacterium sp. 35 TaxID=2035210 RepID=UPI000C19B420|nr:AAA family ATPase [Janthinobacterium sp. 35]PIG26608.1 AAA ATPase-like protein [Janthinobacterium sp. 35]